MATASLQRGSALLARVTEMKLLPAVALRVREVCEDPASDFRDLEAAVGLDPVLSTRILTLANSPVFGVGRPCTSLADALKVLGFRVTKDAALAIALTSMDGGTPHFRRGLWTHAVEVASAASQLGRYVRGVNPATAFLVGLLHDFGVLVLLQLTELELGLVGRYREGDPRLVKAERDAFGIDHAAMGGAVADNLGLPNEMADAIRMHHGIRTRREAPTTVAGKLAAVVAVAERLNQLRERDLHAALIASQVSTDPLARKLDLSRGQLEIVASVYLEEAESLQAVLLPR